MRKIFMTTAVFAGVYLAFSSGCASQLKPIKTINTPEGSGVEQELDFSTIYFSDIHSGSRFSVLDFMNQTGRDHLLLMFGSKGCTSCNLKNEHFKASIIGQHQFYLTDAGKKFEVIGVNTDTEAADRMQLYLTKFDFIRWSDPKGLTMINHFIPPGRTFGVPVTLLINKKGIVFRILNDEKATPEQIMERVEKAIAGTGGDTTGDGGDASDDGDGGDGGDGGDDGGVTPPVIPATDLAYIGPGRFKKVDIKSCDGAAKNLDQVLGQPDFRIVHVAKGVCGDACQKNVTQMKTLSASLCGEDSTASAGTKKCAVAALQTGSTPDQATCASGFAFAGGEKFFEVFETHFNWNYPVVEDPVDFEPKFTKTFDGPITMVFRRDGTLVWSQEGQLAENILSATLKSPPFGLEIVRGPDFPVYSNFNGDKVVKKFADVRRQSKITVAVSTLIFDTIGCGSCVLELEHWSKPGGFLDYCLDRPSECQIMLYDFRDIKGLVPLDQFYDMVKNGGMDPEFNVPIKGLAERGIRVPLYLDPLPASLPDGSVNFARFYEGYLKAASRELGPVGRIAVYNQEGRIIEIFASGQDTEPTDHIFDFVKKTLEGK